MKPHRIPDHSNTGQADSDASPRLVPDWDQVQKRLFELARQSDQRRSESEDFDISHAVMARLRSETPSFEAVENSSDVFWVQALWRAVTPCLLVTLALTLWTFIHSPATQNEAVAPLAITLEETITAPLEPLELPW